MLPSLSAYRAKSFIAERDMSSMAFEVKRTRAVWDDALSVPGTNRRGGWRCPPGTRYGGQITDRFGRNCGWGVSRRLANQISDIGERLENIGDRRRGRRVERRNRQMMERLANRNRPGRIERAAGRVAEALESDLGGTQPRGVVTPQRNRRGVASPQRRRGNLRLSEERRMQREIEQPGAPRTDDRIGGGGERPRPQAPRARRRQAATENVRNRPAQPVEQPVKKAPAKKAAAKKMPAKKAAAKKVPAQKAAAKKTPAKKRVAKKAATRLTPARPRGGSDNAARSEELRQAAAERARAGGQIVDLNNVLNDENFRDYVVGVVIPNDLLMIVNDQLNFPREEERKRRKVLEAEAKIRQAEARLERIEQAISRGELKGNDFIERNGEQISIDRIKTFITQYRDGWQEVRDANLRDLRDATPKAPQKPVQAQPAKRRRVPFRDISQDSRLESAYYGAVDRINAVEDGQYSPQEARERAQDIRQVIRKMNNLNDGDIIVIFDPLAGKEEIPVAELRLNMNAAADAWDRYAERSIEKGSRAANPPAVPLDADVANAAEKRVKDAIKKRKKILGSYLDKRYGKGNAPWKEMTKERRLELLNLASRGDDDAKRQLKEWATAMYTHEEIQGTNGKTYRIIVNRQMGVTIWGDEIVANLEIQVKNPDGTWANVGSSTRTLYKNGKIYHNSMFIRGAEHRNSGIATIYNQHSWMYARAAGFDTIGVSAVDDGPYVWARMGFEDARSLNGQIRAMQMELDKFNDGNPSIIGGKEDADIIQSLLTRYANDPRSVRHMDFIYAISNNGTTKDERDRRERAIKEWFITYMPFRSGTFFLEKNGIVADPRDERD